MKKDIAFLAVGQAGGNIGKLFESLDFNVMYVNTSMEDLRTLTDAKHVYHIAGGEGAARDRERAKDLLLADSQDLQLEISKTFTEEFIFVVFSAGGGTGSGTAPKLMSYLTDIFPESKICGITILPAAGESLKTQANAFQCLAELEKMEEEEKTDLSSLFVIDNNGKPNKILLNEIFADLFMKMLRIPSFTDHRGNIDVMDLKDVLSAKGCTMISALPAEQSSTPKLIDSFKNGIFARQDDRMVKYIALSMASEINTDAFIKVIGKPFDMFQGYNRDSTVCVLSGLNLPFSRIEGIRDLITEEQTEIKKIWDAKKPALLQNSVDLSFMQKNRKTRTIKGPDDVISLFSRG